MGTYLITGGTGSFGSRFVEHLLKQPDVTSVRVYSRDEHKQQKLANLLNLGSLHANKLRFFVGDVRDKDRLKLAMRGVDVVVHAAALKSVPVAEYNPIECIRTNIDGTANAIEAALFSGVQKFLAISSDKAVAPLNLYGMTKAVMEKLVVHANAYRGSYSGTRFACVRYGNVVGSNSSVVELWRKEHDEDRPLTVTSLESTRFWLTMPEAVNFVWSSLQIMNTWGGGELFIPKIPSIRIRDLYEVMKNGQGCKTIGLRPGEKLHETLVIEPEMRRSYQMADRYIVPPENPTWEYKIPVGAYVTGLSRVTYSSDINEFLSVGRIHQTLATC